MLDFTARGHIFLTAEVVVVGEGSKTALVGQRRGIGSWLGCMAQGLGWLELKLKDLGSRHDASRLAYACQKCLILGDELITEARSRPSSLPEAPRAVAWVAWHVCRAPLKQHNTFTWVAIVRNLNQVSNGNMGI